MLRVDVLAGPGAQEVARALAERDSEGRVEIAVVSRPGAAALVLDPTAQLDPGEMDRLWHTRIEPFARAVAGLAEPPPGPPLLAEHDPAAGVLAADWLSRLRAELLRRGLDDGSWTYDHIGSTAVPSLRAKRFIDLQLGVAPLPVKGSAFDEVLRVFGLVPAKGSRPDSPGVHRDQVKDPSLAPDDAYRKRLFVRPDPVRPAILHVRQLGSPWWSYAVLFRDWLRADSAGRRAYQEMKERAAAAHAEDADYDDYTRAKSRFFAEYQAEYQWFGAASEYRLRR